MRPEESSSVENAWDVREALEKEALEEIEEQLMEDMDGNVNSLQGTAPSRDEAVDLEEIMREDVATRAHLEQLRSALRHWSPLL